MRKQAKIWRRCPRKSFYYDFFRQCEFEYNRQDRYEKMSIKNSPLFELAVCLLFKT